MAAPVTHIDFDAFFASVEAREKPFLAGLPLVIGADPKGGEGRGVVATASYAARALGIRSAMPIRRAWRLSEEARKAGRTGATFVTPEYRKYAQASDEAFAWIRSQVTTIEQVSIDEAYLDLGAPEDYVATEALARRLKDGIWERFSLPASIGIGPNVMLAKMAVERAKPDGIFTLLPEESPAFLERLPVRAIPGVGPATERTLTRAGYRTIGDLRDRLHPARAAKLLGAYGYVLVERAHGIGRTELSGEPAEALSLGEEETFDEDLENLAQVRGAVKEIVSRVALKALRKDVQEAGVITVKVRFEDFESHTASSTKTVIVADARRLEASALALILPFLDRRKNPSGKRVRLLGVTLARLSYGP